jgi:hypothetical protein
VTARRSKATSSGLELAFSGVKKASDEEDAQDEAPSRFAMSFKGMNGDFESQIIDDLWMSGARQGAPSVGAD